MVIIVKAGMGVIMAGAIIIEVSVATATDGVTEEETLEAAATVRLPEATTAEREPGSLFLNPIPHTMPTPFSSKPLVAVWYLFALSLACLDQATKYAIETLMPLRASIEVSSFFNLVHVLNPGAAFSFLADAGGWQRYLFVGLGATVSALLMFGLWRGVRSQFETAAYVCVIGGALGNVIDRLRIGAVVDFLDFHWQGWHWPAFNLADVFVVSGAALLILASVAEPRVNLALQRSIGNRDRGATL